MCGRYVNPDEAAIERAWHIGRHNNDPIRRRFNVQPTSTIPVLRLHPETRELELVAARWGLIPHWWKEARPPNFAFNARIEEAASKPLWRDALRCTRCLVPAEGWYEWQAHERTAAVAGKARRYKQPFFVRRRDRRLLCFAGLLARPSAADSGEPAWSCAILTTAAAGGLARIHDRMPVATPDAVHAAWLEPGLKDGTQAIDAIRSTGWRDEFEYYAVSALVNDGRVDGPELVAPLNAADVD
jgi:putative SOS response-associated peptidase YedK